MREGTFAPAVYLTASGLVAATGADEHSRCDQRGVYQEGATVNKQDLKQVLEREGIRPDAFDLDGGHVSERYTLSESHGLWSVYYSERGLESGRRTCAVESDACEYLLRLLRDDESTHVL